MPRFALAAALMLAACGQAEPPPPLPQAQTATADAVPPWFICDAIDAPMVLVFQRDGETVEVAQYDKPNGALAQRTSYGLGAGEGAAGSVYTALQQNGVDVGHVREVNTGVIENPASAYTPLYTSVRLGERDIACRWMPRTRVLGFTGRRSFVVHEDRDGDLIYTTYDFTAASSAQPIELSENGRSTTFSVEVRDGAETVSANGAEYRFSGQNGFSYVVSLDSAGAGRLDVLRNGATVQSEPLVAFVQGDAAQP